MGNLAGIAPQGPLVTPEGHQGEGPPAGQGPGRSPCWLGPCTPRDVVRQRTQDQRERAAHHVVRQRPPKIKDLPARGGQDQRRRQPKRGGPGSPKRPEEKLLSPEGLRSGLQGTGTAWEDLRRLILRPEERNRCGPAVFT